MDFVRNAIVLRVGIAALLSCVDNFAGTTALAVGSGTGQEEPLEVQQQPQDRECEVRIFQDGPPGRAFKLAINIEIRHGEPNTLTACTTNDQMFQLRFSEPVPHTMFVTESNSTLNFKYLLKVGRKCMYWPMESIKTPFEVVSCSEEEEEDCSCPHQVHIEKEEVSEEADGLDGDVTTAAAARAPVAASETPTSFPTPEVPEAKTHGHTSVEEDRAATIESPKTKSANGLLATDGDAAINHTTTEPANRWNDQQDLWSILSVAVVYLCGIIWLAFYLHRQQQSGRTPDANLEANVRLLPPPV
ncbi:hypothetical protein BV898_08802 [Hypsibius exemplaris]|uniref:Uncharacterized protein n=1 Tax=Hypsibius exemplaris TaxID=2072580 RepID=A0A1W0WPF5_HYPEX|nr:hypothetical protein BV898_08802 [Hypsibius exemplaris]